MNFGSTNWLNKKKKKKKKSQEHNKCHDIKVNFCSPNLTKPKKKSRNITKCHNIFTILLFSVVVNFGLIYIYIYIFIEMLSP